MSRSATRSRQPFEIDEPFELDRRPARGDADAGGRRARAAAALADSAGSCWLRCWRSRLAGAGTLGYSGWQMSSQKDATLSTPAADRRAAPGHRRDDGKHTADYLQTALSAEIDLDKTVGAVYSDASGNERPLLRRHRD